MVEKAVTVPRNDRFGTIGLAQNWRKAWTVFRQVQVTPGKACFFAEADDDDSLPVLRGEALPVDHLVMYIIAQLASECLKYHAEGATLVVRKQILDVFQQERLGALGGDDASQIEKPSPLCGALETMRAV